MKLQILQLLLVYIGICTAYTVLKQHELKYFSDKKNVELLDPENENGLLYPILKPRLPGSKGSKEVRDHIISFFETLDAGWNIEQDAFVSETPTGPMNFTNLIITRDAPSSESDLKRLTLVAHYDSKAEPEGFIGAIDSAYPCALLMYLAAQVDTMLTEHWSTGTDSLGLQLVFLDGEEAIKDWTDTDSIYGARHLASRWESEKLLESIDLFVLLDLLGSSNPSIYSFYASSHVYHEHLQAIEKTLRRNKLLKSRRGAPSWFRRAKRFEVAGQLGDDHVPFVERGVSVLHLIPVPFPDTWHTIKDTGKSLDPVACHDWALIMTAFVAEYMNLTGFVSGNSEL